MVDRDAPGPGEGAGRGGEASGERGSHSTSVFVTGAGSGLGAALCRHYAASGANLGLYGRRHDALLAVAAAIPAERVAIFPGDVRDAAALDRAAREFVARFGAPDIVIANAGVSVGALTGHPEDLATFRDVFDTNVAGVVHTFSPFVDAMREAKRGVLAGIASVAGFRGLAGSGAYSASKAAVITYLEALRLELRGSGVAVVTVCPGYIATPMTETNPYGMPFLLQSDEAARRIARAIQRRRRFCVVPWQMAIVGRLLRALPRPVYDAVFARAPRKSRHAG